MPKLNIFTRINRSASLEECKDDILTLAANIGIGDLISRQLETATSDYEIGMIIAKVFDVYGVVPKMEWLDYVVRQMYE